MPSTRPPAVRRARASRRPIIGGLLVACAVIALAGEAAAGPPYLSDDPQPTDPGHWEIYNFVGGMDVPGDLSGAAGLDINCGAAENTQLTAVLPVMFSDARGFSPAGLRGGPGDVELAVKYRFLHQADASWTPDVAVFPRLFVPTAGRRFGTGEAGLLVPIWVERDRGPWSVFGGGGYQINHGNGQRSFWQGGVALSRALGRRLTLGAEVYGQSRNTADGGGYLALNLAATYALVDHWSLLASAGPSWNQGSADGAVFYIALKADY